MSGAEAQTSQDADPAEALIRDPDCAATVVALSQTRTRDLVLPRRIHKAYLAHTWRSRRKINAGWLFWAAALNAACCALTPFIAAPELMETIVACRVAITVLFALGAGAILSMRSHGSEGFVVIAVCLAVTVAVGLMAAASPPHLAERYIVQAIFLFGTAIVVSRLPWFEIRILAAVVILASTALIASPAANALTLAEKVQMAIFFNVGLVGLVLAKQAMIKLKYRVFILGLVDRMKVLEIEEMNARLHAMARTDQLTSVANRRGFDEAFAALKARPEAQSPAAVLMIDIDFFKRLNDARGHSAGDDCLKVVAGVISGELRRGDDLLARYGGEEFVAILPGVDASGAVVIAERVREAVAARAIPHPEADCGIVTVSVGVAAAPPAAIERLVARADAALYEAKAGGRNAVKLAPAPAALRIA